MFQIAILVLVAFFCVGFIVVFHRAVCAAADVLFDDIEEE